MEYVDGDITTFLVALVVVFAEVVGAFVDADTFIGMLALALVVIGAFAGADTYISRS